MSENCSLNRRRVSLCDVAREVGVSHVTVSRVLRGVVGVRSSRRIEIEAAALRMGYRPDPMLSSLAAFRQAKRPLMISATVAWLNQWTDPSELHRLHEFEAYWKGACHVAEKRGYRLEEIKIRPDCTSGRLQKILDSRKVQGILIPPHRIDLRLPNFDWSPYSLIRLGVSVKEPRAHVVTSDQMKCVSTAFERMKERRYQRVGYVSSLRFDHKTGGNFRAGYLSSQDELFPLKKHMPPLLLEDDSTTTDAGRLKGWLKRFKPDAIITTIASLRGLLDRIGCRIPEDIAVCAMSVFDGNFDSGIDQNSFEVGCVAMQTLADLIHQNERGIPCYCRKILVEPRWIDGNSLPLRTCLRGSQNPAARIISEIVAD